MRGVLVLSSLLLLLSLIAILGWDNNTSAKASLCGPNALYTAMKLVGIPIQYQEIVDLCDVGSDGVSLGRLSKLASQHGCATEMLALTWGELLETDTVVILYFNNKHFVCVDTRRRERSTETASEANVLLKVYDNRKPGTRWSETQFADLWEGEALIIRKRGDREVFSSNNPFEWSTCLYDFGEVHSSDGIIRCEIHCSNRLKEASALSVVGTTCGCTQVSLSKTRLLSGGIATLEVSIDLTAKRGAFYEQVLLRSSLPNRKEFIIHVCGWALPKSLTSVDEIHFGEVRRSQTLHRKLLIRTPWFSKAYLGEP